MKLCRLTLKNSPLQFGSLAKLFHWSMAIIIVCLFAAGLIMSDMANSPDRFTVIFLHKSFGILILFLVALRLMWRLISPPPALPNSMTRTERLAAHLGHFGLYGLMFCVPLLGWLLSSAAGYSVSVFKLFTLPDIISPDKPLRGWLGELHEIGAWALVLLAAVHASAAMWHHFVKKDSVLRRMLPCAKVEVE